MTDPSDQGAITLAVGQIQGQMRELIHKQNNMDMKLDGVVEKLLTGPSAADFAAALVRITALETKESERRGATNFGVAIMKSPAAAWIAAGIGVIYGAIKGGLLK